jgi:hypothetical protein
VNRVCSFHPSISAGAFAAAMLLSSADQAARAATPYSEATVTRVQNKVKYGEQNGGQSATRPAAPQDVVRARNFLLSESDSRAELQYPDGTIVRIGQNTVFSFEAETRTLNLTKGTFIFYVPKGQGGATIKTPSLTAAITGTVGKVSGDTIAIIEGSIKLIPSGQVVTAGQFARRNPDGTITIDFFKKGTEFDGVLMTFNGPLPPFREGLLKTGLVLDLSQVQLQETLERTANHPNANQNFYPEDKHEVKEEKKNDVVPPTPTPRIITPTPRPKSPTTPIDGGEGEFRRAIIRR